MSLVAFIPARAGSKGIPGKNMIDLAGVPLIHHTFAAAQASKHITHIFLTTDSDEILSYAQSLGIETPYKRPAELAEDTTPMISAILHGLDWLEARGRTFDNMILLQPTSPLRTAADIDSAYEKFLAAGSQSLTSVNEMVEHPFECTCGMEEGWTYLAEPPEGASRRQDYGQRFFFINGAIYIVDISMFRVNKRFIEPSKTTLFEMPSERSIDIDTMHDLHIARALKNTFA